MEQLGFTLRFTLRFFFVELQTPCFSSISGISGPGAKLMEHTKHFIRLSEEPQRFKASKEYQKEFSEPIPETSLSSFFLVAQEQTMVFPEPTALGPAGSNHIIRLFEILVV